MGRITIDPVTRIEGHLRVQATIDGGEVKEVSCSGVMFRGFELMLKGRDPRDAQKLTQRVCGVCPAVHATASALALDQAFGIDGEITDNGRILRNLILGANFLQSHILHFYHLAALDYVDITAAADYAGSNADLQSVRNLLTRGALGPFTPRLEGDYRLSSESNRMATAHYIQALRMRRKTHELLAIFGGKMPHDMGIVPGGVTATPTADKITAFYHGINEVRTFIDNIYLPDVLAIAAAYNDYFAIGKGADSLLSYGAFDLVGGGGDPMACRRFLPQGLVNASLTKQDVDVSKITEYVTHSWYDEDGGNRHPAREDTVPAEDKQGAYSWIKSPRYDDKVTEVGPLARMLTAYLSAHPQARELIEKTLSAAAVKLEDLASVCGRHAARAIEARILADAMADWVLQIKPGEPAYVDSEVPQEAQGTGLTEGPRGALGHWARIKDYTIDNYQLVVPTTWNASPKDANGNLGPMEKAMVGTKVRDENNPYEVVRIIRSFDPCLACAVHAVDHRGEKIGAYSIA